MSKDTRQPLDSLLQNTGMWRASTIDCNFRSAIPTGFAELDQYLPGSGWPCDGLTELLYNQEGIGELRLLAPALAHLSQTQGRWLLWVSPPHVPYAPALASCGVDLARVLLVTPKSRKDILWTLEKALASQSCSAVLAWPGQIREKEIRRLQVASQEGQSLGILFRDSRTARQASPAELRIQLSGSSVAPVGEHSALDLRILKRRGGWATDTFTINFNDRLNQVTPDFSEIVVKRPQQPHDTQHPSIKPFPSSEPESHGIEFS